MADQNPAATQASPPPAATQVSTTTTAATPVATRASAATRQKLIDVTNYTLEQLVPAWKYQEKRFRRNETTYHDLIAQIGDGPLTNTFRGNLQAHTKILEHLSQQCDVIYEKHKELLKDAYKADLANTEYIESNAKLDEEYQELMDDVDNIRDTIAELLSRETKNICCIAVTSFSRSRRKNAGQVSRNGISVSIVSLAHIASVNVLQNSPAKLARRSTIAYFTTRTRPPTLLDSMILTLATKNPTTLVALPRSLHQLTPQLQ